eukprot:2965044-Rhodomonas_salina.2
MLSDLAYGATPLCLCDVRYRASELAYGATRCAAGPIMLSQPGQLQAGQIQVSRTEIAYVSRTEI